MAIGFMLGLICIFLGFLQLLVALLQKYVFTEKCSVLSTCACRQSTLSADQESADIELEEQRDNSITTEPSSMQAPNTPRRVSMKSETTLV